MGSGLHDAARHPVGDRDQVVSVGAFRAAAYDPQTGKEIWRVSYGDGFSNVPRPVFGHGLVYIATGFFQPAILAVRPDGTGDVSKTHVGWTLRRGAPLTPSPLVVGDELYVVTDAGIATCLNARTGAVLWQERLNGTFSASPRLRRWPHLLSGRGRRRHGDRAGPAIRRLASNTLDGATLASMAVAGGSIYIRSATHLYRIGRERAAPGDVPHEPTVHSTMNTMPCWTCWTR